MPRLHPKNSFMPSLVSGAHYVYDIGWFRRTRAEKAFSFSTRAKRAASWDAFAAFSVHWRIPLPPQSPHTSRSVTHLKYLALAPFSTFYLFCIFSWVDGFADWHVLIRLACESMLIANPHHRSAVLVYCATAYEAPMEGRFRTMSTRLVNHCRIRHVPFRLQIYANCKSTTQIFSLLPLRSKRIRAL